MPDANPSFENFLENDLQRLAQEIRTQREKPEMKSVGEQELVKEAIRAFPEVRNMEAGRPSAAPAPQSNNPLPAYAQNAPAETKLEIEYLLDVALRKGVGKALSESQKSADFVQDAFHDALAGKLYPELQKRGIVK